MQVRLAGLGENWSAQGSVATLGNLDGVHRGHQAILKQARERADELGVPSVAVVFEPQPREYFAHSKTGLLPAPARLTKFKEKILALAPFVDGVQVLKFNAQLSSQSPEQFVQHWLLDQLGIQHLVVGDDFRFGAKRAGDYALLERMGAQHGFSVERTRQVLHKGRRISSTWVREALAENNLGLAEALLGRPYRMRGHVNCGMQLARTLGFPTANVKLGRQTPALRGVFAVRVNCEKAHLVNHPAVANLGSRPSVEGRPVGLEVHLLDYQGDLYGHELDVEFIHHLRDEQKFDGLDALTQQIHRDHAQARALLN